MLQVIDSPHEFQEPMASIGISARYVSISDFNGVPRMTSKILFHTPQSLDTLDSGSSVRPAKMISAFEKMGYDVDTVAGGTEERRVRIKDIQKVIQKYEFCYSEPTTWPLHPIVDYRLYWHLRTNDVPTGIFYRDIYWQFPELFDQSGLKYWELQTRYRLDLAIISRVANQLYVPSATFGEHLNLNSSVTPLPPGGINRIESNTTTSRLRRVIYVGGISETTGSELLSKALEAVAQRQNITLDLVCPETEYRALSEQARNRFNSEWAEVHHVHGSELQALYKRADAGIIPRESTTYNNMSMPVKLFEYLSYGLPIITTDIDEVASFVHSSDCGIVCEANYGDIAQAVMLLSTDEKLYQRKKENAIQTLKQNQWLNRAEQVASDLVNTETSPGDS